MRGSGKKAVLCVARCAGTHNFELLYPSPAQAELTSAGIKEYRKYIKGFDLHPHEEEHILGNLLIPFQYAFAKFNPIKFLFVKTYL